MAFLLGLGAPASASAGAPAGHDEAEAPALTGLGTVVGCTSARRTGRPQAGAPAEAAAEGGGAKAGPAPNGGAVRRANSLGREDYDPPASLLTPKEAPSPYAGETVVARSFEHITALLFENSYRERHLDPALAGGGAELRLHHELTALFRGLPNANFEPLTSLQVLGPDEHAARVEASLIACFKKHALLEEGMAAQLLSNPNASVWEWLAVARHHGLPTRFLDWSRSPYVALHFATNDLNHADKDAVIFEVDPKRLAERYHVWNEWHSSWVGRGMTPCHGILTHEALVDYLEFCGAYWHRYKVPDDVAKQDTGQLLMMDRQSMPCVFLEPQSLSTRISHQKGCFSILRHGVHLAEELSESHPQAFRKIVIPKEIKREVRDKLDAIGFTERLFKPGLDGLCEYIKRAYAPPSV